MNAKRAVIESAALVVLGTWPLVWAQEEIVTKTATETTQAVQANDAEANKAWMRDYLAATSGQEKTEALMREFTDNEALLEHVRVFEPAFPRYEVLVDEMITEGDKVVLLARVRGQHQGEFAGIAATGKQIEFPGIVIYQLAGGKIVGFWAQADMMSLMQQLTGNP